MTDTDITIQFKDITLAENHLFTGYSLTVEEKEKVLITGKSGSGKTTLLRMLLGFTRPDSGEVLYRGRPLGPEILPLIRRELFYLSQDIDLPQDPVETQIKEILSANDLDTEPSRLPALLELLELDRTILSKQATALSGGERQRLGLLLGFLLDRPVWLLDEPTAALDGAMKQTAVQAILDQNKTMIIISHDPVWESDPRLTLERW